MHLRGNGCARGIGGSLEFGVVFSHDKSTGWKFGAYSESGLCGYVGKTGGSIGLQGTYTPSAKSMSAPV